VIVFLDASALIYLIEGAEPFVHRVRAQLADLNRRHGTLEVALSRLSWLECRIRPARNREFETLTAFDAFFARPDLTWVELTRDVVELATEVRIEHGLRTPDALQAASCLQLGPDHVFLTGDGGLKKVAGLHATVLR